MLLSLSLTLRFSLNSCSRTPLDLQGSKFFNNEVLQDERITRNIDELLDKRDAALAALHTGSEAERKAKWASVEAKIQAQVSRCC